MYINCQLIHSQQGLEPRVCNRGDVSVTVGSTHHGNVVQYSLGRAVSHHLGGKRTDYQHITATFGDILSYVHIYA